MTPRTGALPVTYTMNNGQAMTAAKTKAAARGRIHEVHNPCLVEVRRVEEVGYDAYSYGWPIPSRLEDGTELAIIERCTITARGHRWRPIASEQGA
jgi:hypothetical protein